MLLAEKLLLIAITGPGWKCHCHCVSAQHMGQLAVMSQCFLTLQVNTQYNDSAKSRCLPHFQQRHQAHRHHPNPPMLHLDCMNCPSFGRYQ